MPAYNIIQEGGDKMQNNIGDYLNLIPDENMRRKVSSVIEGGNRDNLINELKSKIDVNALNRAINSSGSGDFNSVKNNLENALSGSNKQEVTKILKKFLGD